MKYTQDELKAKATYVVNAEGTAKYKEMVMMLAIKCGMLPAKVEQKIRSLAND